MLLAGDIGGTKTVLALFDFDGDGRNAVRESTFPSRSYPTFDAILREFLGDPPPSTPLRAACFGIAGTIVEGRSQLTNLNWTLGEGALAAAVGAPKVKLLNDLEATAYGILLLPPEEIRVLQPAGGLGRRGNIGVIAAGTGLGEALLCWDSLGERYYSLASEGGHADFAPRDEREIALLQYLRAKVGGHVSYERVLSGPGFRHLYEFLRDAGYYAESPSIAEQLTTGDPNATISTLGITGDDPLCAATVEMFCSLYGAEAGNLALRGVTLGGVFLGGGIAPKLLPALERGEFLRSFNDKGRFAAMLTRIEVAVSLNPRAALLGAAHYAARLAGRDIPNGSSRA